MAKETQASIELQGKFRTAMSRFISMQTSSDAFMGELMAAVSSTPMLVREWGGGALFKVEESEFNDSCDGLDGYTVWVEREVDEEDDNA
jgi:hypothetical protein